MLAQPAGQSPFSGLLELGERCARVDADLLLGGLVNLFLRSCVAASLRSPENSVDHADAELLLACYYHLGGEPVDSRLIRPTIRESSAVPVAFAFFD